MQSPFESVLIQSNVEYAFPYQTKLERFEKFKEALEVTTSFARKEKIIVKQHIHIANVGIIMIS